MQRSRAYDVTMMVLLLGSVAVVFWYEALDPQDDAALRTLIERVDLALVIFFVLEWIWRVRKAPSPSYGLRNSWELLGMVPLLLPLPAFLRALRLLRIVRILRVFGTVGRALGAWERLAKQASLHKIVVASGTITLAGALLVWALERGAPNAQLTNFSDALWWAIVTITTVGYGDYAPVTTMGRFVAALLMVTGIGTIGLFASTIASVLVAQDQETHGPMVVRAGHLAEQLRQLDALHDKGSLTDAEFAAAKQQILG